MTEQPRILVVDDDDEILGLTRTVLAGAGFRVTTASSGDEALRVARSEGFDLALLDIQMPGMDGWETLRLMKADDALRGVEVVMFSVKAEFRDKIHGMQEGAVDYISKPFQVDELLSRVRRILERQGAGGPDRPTPVGR